ncbi:MAG: glycosyltransferase [Lunatimonas sp.]|uniref:glycosyltransferase n=1 Tax=Lunatimonas sp. TaxID=2060141 RepID=UPI00263B133E|nr:glycosyltransferase [Lunatimonas sp.]MCC5939729.1 glycosyltransferase [Lunatimonas sp.]
MKKIILVSSYTFHYRLKVYNYFSKRFRELGYEFILLTEGKDDIDDKLEFRTIIEKSRVLSYIKHLEREKPDTVITFLTLKDLVNFPISIFCRAKNIPLVTWTKSIDIKTPNHLIKNFLYHKLHDLSDAMVLYTPNEIKYVQEKNRPKVFFGYNTLSFDSFDKEKVPGLDYVKEKYGIREDTIVLFAATIKPDKNLDALLNFPCTNKDIAIVVAGRGINQQQKDKINELENYYYIGQVPYDDYEMNALFKSASYFTTPGDLGLALNQALFWAKPVVALDGPHSVEVYYLKSGYNGYLAKDMPDFWTFIETMQKDQTAYSRLTENCRETFENKAAIPNMFKGFMDAVNFAIERKKAVR